MTSPIAANDLKEIISYDPASGGFLWKVSRSKKVKVGARIGSWDLYGYQTVRIDGRSYKLHRLAWLYMTGEWPVGDVDHINGVRHDNRFSNLRDVPRGQNLENRRAANPGKKSGLPLGVHRERYAFSARISRDNCSIVLGHFPTPEEASAAYIQAKRALHRGCMI